MIPTMKLGIDQLSIDARLALVEEIWDSILANPDLPQLSEEQQRLLDTRMADLDANPGNVLTWDEIKRSVRGC